MLTELFVSIAVFFGMEPSTLVSFIDLYAKSLLLVLFVLYIERSASPFFSSAQKRLLWIAALLSISILPLSSLFASFVWAELQLAPSLNLLTVVIPSSTELNTQSTVSLIEYWFLPSLFLYLCGVVFHLIKLGASLLELNRIRQSASYDAPRYVEAILVDLCERLDIRREVRLGISPLCNSPVTFGTLRVSIILPSTDYYSDITLLENVLVHELSHVKRFDNITYMIAYILAAMNWFNPFIWFCLKELDIESEYACDDDVIRGKSRRVEFASQLVAIAKHGLAQCNSAIAARPALSRGQLTRRVEHILHDTFRSSSGRTYSCVVPIYMLAVVFTLASTVRIFAIGDENSFVSEDLRLIYSELPEYPELAIQKGATGFATYSFRVNEEGKVDIDSIELVRSEPMYLFDKSSVRSLNSFVFSPKRTNGRNVATSNVQFTFQFDMRI